LADFGLGGIIAAVDKKNHEEELKNLINRDCLPYAHDTWDHKVWTELVNVRGQFNAWLIKEKRTITELPPSLFLNLCAIDGATFVNQSDGEILAFGAITKIKEGDPDQGARTTAAKFLSKKFGPVLEISEDRNVTLFNKGELIGRIW